MTSALRLLVSVAAMLAAVILPAHAAAGKAIVFFRNGSTIPAILDRTETPRSGGAPSIILNSPVLNAPISTLPSELKEVILPDNAKKGEGQCMIRLFSNEQISGEINTVSSSGTTIRPLWGENISLPSEAIAYMNINNPGSLLYSGTEDISGWSGFTPPFPTPPRSWSSYRGTFLSMPPGGTIARDVKLPPAIHISMVVQGNPFVRFLMHIWKDVKAPTADKNGSYVDFYLLNDVFQITEIVRSSINTVANDPISQNREEDDRKAQTPVALDLFADRKAGYYCFYVNKKLVKQCTTEEISPGDESAPSGEALSEYGTGLSLESFDSVLLISSLRITQWNGKYPGDELLPPEERLPIPRPGTQDNDMALLVNGDVLRGNIRQLSGKELLIQSDLYKIKVPLDKIIQLRMQTKPDRTGNAYTIAGKPIFYLTDGSILRGELEKIENGSWTISSLSLGSVTIPDTMFSRIVFPETRSSPSR